MLPKGVSSGERRSTAAVLAAAKALLCPTLPRTRASISAQARAAAGVFVRPADLAFEPRSCEAARGGLSTCARQGRVAEPGPTGTGAAGPSAVAGSRQAGP